MKEPGRMATSTMPVVGSMRKSAGPGRHQVGGKKRHRHRGGHDAYESPSGSQEQSTIGVRSRRTTFCRVSGPDPNEDDDRRWPVSGTDAAADLAAAATPRVRVAADGAGRRLVRLDPGLGRARVSRTTARPLRRQHLPSAAAHTGVFGEPDRQRLHRGADHLGHRQPRARPQRGRAAVGVAVRPRRVCAGPPPRSRPGGGRGGGRDLRLLAAAVLPLGPVAPWRRPVDAVRVWRPCTRTSTQAGGATSSSPPRCSPCRRSRAGTAPCSWRSPWLGLSSGRPHRGASSRRSAGCATSASRECCSLLRRCSSILPTAPCNRRSGSGGRSRTGPSPPSSFIAAPTHVQTSLLSLLPGPRILDTASAFLFPGPPAAVARPALAALGALVSDAAGRPMLPATGRRLLRRCSRSCLWLSIGPPFGVWPLVYWLPGMSFIRVPSRFTILAMLGLAIVAAAGFDWLARGLPRARGRAFAAIATAAARGRVRGRPARGHPVPRGHLRWPIAGSPRSPGPFAVAEVPLPDPRHAGAFERRQTMFMLHSTAHWQKTVHGYSGIRAPLHDGLYVLLSERSRTMSASRSSRASTCATSSCTRSSTRPANGSRSRPASTRHGAGFGWNTSPAPAAFTRCALPRTIDYRSGQPRHWYS